MVAIYVLKLQNNKYYVGKTTNPHYRLNEHFSECGSEWTKKYKPICIHELRPDKTATDEQIVTQEYMKKYGINNVRGGPWCKISLTKSEEDLITKIIQSNTDNCYKCGKPGHFSSACYATSDVEGNVLQKDEEDEEEKDEEDEEDENSDCDEDDDIKIMPVWCCLYCGKEFDTERCANYHERFYCNNTLLLFKKNKFLF